MPAQIYEVLFDADADGERTAALSRRSDSYFGPETGAISDLDEQWFDAREIDLADYQPATNIGRLCSDKLREVLSGAASADDSLQWLPARVVTPRRTLRYWVLHFPSPLDPFSNRTQRINGVVTHQVLSAAKVRGHSVFTFRGDQGIGFMVDALARQVMIDSGCTGFTFSLVDVDP